MRLGRRNRQVWSQEPDFRLIKMDNRTRFTEGNADNKTDTQIASLHRSKNLIFTFMTLYIVLAVLVIIGNTLVIIAFTKLRFRRVINIFFVSLAVSDLLVGAMSIPLWIYNLSCPHFASCLKQSELVIKFYQSFDIFSALASISNLVAISVERYFAICWPVQHKISSFARYYLIIFSIWSYSLIVTIIYSVESSSMWKKYRGILVFVAGFVIPVIIIILMYSSIYRSVKTMNAHWNQTNARSALRNSVRRERRTATTVWIVTMLFMVAWLPFFVVSLLWSLRRASLPNEQDFFRLMDFIKWMHYSNSAVNPVVYAYRSEEMRRMLAKLVAPATRREEEIARVARPENRNN